MGTWFVQLDRALGVVRMRLSGSPSELEMQRGFEGLKHAIAELGGADFRVLSDSLELRLLTPAAMRVQEEAKAYCAGTPGFRGSAAAASR